MQSIEEKIYEVFWDKNIARMINRADLFSFLKQYVNPGLLTRSSKSELVHDLKEYMTTANLEFIAERMESFGLPICWILGWIKSSCRLHGENRTSQTRRNKLSYFPINNNTLGRLRWNG